MGSHPRCVLSALGRNNMLETVSSELNKYGSDGDLLLCGDFNARTGCQVSDFIINDDDLHASVSRDYL